MQKIEEQEAGENGPPTKKQQGPKINSWLVFFILTGLALIAGKIFFPDLNLLYLLTLVQKYVGIFWPFFAIVATGLFYATSARLSHAFHFTTEHDWNLINRFLHWATEACPLVGLLATFLSFLFALLAYAEAGPRQPEADAAFIKQFAIVLGSSISGGLLSLWAFTLSRFSPSKDPR